MSSIVEEGAVPFTTTTTTAILTRDGQLLRKLYRPRKSAHTNAGQSKPTSAWAIGNHGPNGSHGLVLLCGYNSGCISCTQRQTQLAESVSVSVCVYPNLQVSSLSLSLAPSAIATPNFRALTNGVFWCNACVLNPPPHQTTTSTTATRLTRKRGPLLCGAQVGAIY